MSVKSQQFDSWLARDGKKIKLGTRVSGAADKYGDGAESFTDSIVSSRVHPLRAEDILVEPGFVLYDYRRVHISISITVSPLDRVIIDDVIYRVQGPPVKGDSYQEFIVRRQLQ